MSALPIIIGFLAGFGGPLSGVGPMLTDVDAIASRVAAYAPAVCRATDGPLDRLSDLWASSRLTTSLAAAADAVCAANLDSPLARLQAIGAALRAVEAANAALDRRVSH